uniref:Serine-threonine/tyrosine-protein kinase catalytic domain-containing protein n=1 Tax=Ananas comosus var. bracteatus TaxID=296719 RepID=A0A6V7P2C0_ANACO|nr:unnamed protein product [Ananas comosus var. bracteatus]
MPINEYNITFTFESEEEQINVPEPAADPQSLYTRGRAAPKVLYLKAEVIFLGQLSHPNLVKLVGYCCEDDHRVLIYEFMPRVAWNQNCFQKTIKVDIPEDKYPTLCWPPPRSGQHQRSSQGGDDERKAGNEHLNEPLHILVEAELPAEIIDARLMQARDILEDLLKPMDESQDFFKKQQLRELALLDGTLREEGIHMSGSVSPFHKSPGMKRAKTRGKLKTC